MNNNLHHVMLLQYLVRFTNELELQLKSMRENLDLNKLDAVDIIEFIETRAAYQIAVQMEKDIVQILSYNFG